MAGNSDIQQARNPWPPAPWGDIHDCMTATAALEQLQASAAPKWAYEWSAGAPEICHVGEHNWIKHINLEKFTARLYLSWILGKLYLQSTSKYIQFDIPFT